MAKFDEPFKPSRHTKSMIGVECLARKSGFNAGWQIGGFGVTRITSKPTTTQHPADDRRATDLDETDTPSTSRDTPSNYCERLLSGCPI